MYLQMKITRQICVISVFFLQFAIAILVVTMPARNFFFLLLFTITVDMLSVLCGLFSFSCIYFTFGLCVFFGKNVTIHVKCGSSAIYLGLLWFPFGNGARDNEHTFSVIQSVEKTSQSSHLLNRNIYTYISLGMGLNDFGKQIAQSMKCLSYVCHAYKTTRQTIKIHKIP